MFPMPGRIRNRRGFTLLELLLTFVLFTAGFLALSQALTLGLAVSGTNEDLLVGINLAQEKLEELRNKSYSSVASETKAAVSGFSAFQREVTVTTPQTNLKQVTVTVYWNHKSSEISTSLVTYVGNFS